MKIICVDDEELSLKNIVSICSEIDKFSNVKGFISPNEALDYVKNGNRVDIAFLDIDMPNMNGIMLAKQIKIYSPKTVIIFRTAYSEYALDAFQIDAFGYLLKPATKQDIEQKICQINMIRQIPFDEERVVIRTFGNFEVFVNGKPVSFKRNKSREVLAYIVDRMGTGATRAEIAAVIWEDGIYDSRRQAMLTVFLHELKKSLAESGAKDILISSNGRFMINMDAVSCDMYKFLKGDAEAINSFRGEYMNEYSWAEFTAAYLSEK